MRIIKSLPDCLYASDACSDVGSPGSVFAWSIRATTWEGGQLNIMRMDLSKQEKLRYLKHP